MEMTMRAMLWVVIAATVYGLMSFGVLSYSNDAMEKCQEKHSYDTCFQQLNR